MPPNRQSKSEWKPFNLACPTPIVIAEPQHRLGPKGVSSGLSIRRYPKSSVQKVREICLHYVQKCSGKYEYNKTAARYIHQMADEVINQLASVASIIKKNDEQPDVLQSLLDEWNENFPPSLGAMGTPKAVAATLSRQSYRIEELENALAAETLRREKSVGDAMRSLDAQLQAARDGVMTERRQLSVTQQIQVAEYEKSLREADAISQAKVKLAKETMDRSLQTLKREYDLKLGEARLIIGNLQDELDEERARSHLASDTQLKNHEEEVKRLNETIEELENQVLQAQGAVLVTSNGAYDSTDSSVVTLELGSTIGGDDDDLSTLGDQSHYGDDGSTAGSANTELTPTGALMKKLKKQARRAKSKKAGRKSLQLHGAVADAVKNLKERLKVLEESNEDCTKTITQLSAELQETRTQRSTYKRRMDDLQEINEALRKALSLRVYGDQAATSMRGSQTIQGRPKPLSHTPHFLSHTSKLALK